MLSLFPQLFYYPFLAYFLLRIVVTYYTLLLSWDRFKKPYSFIAIFELISALFVGIGFYTQGALLATIFFLIIESIIDVRTHKYNSAEQSTKIILMLVSVALLFLGPGSFAFDLPL
jgi:uncharacterized membrane protein YphA (DoxX/SURF4 family)